MDVFLKFVFIKESSDFAVLYVVCLATNARLRCRVWWRVKEFKKGEFCSLFDNVFKVTLLCLKLSTIVDVFLKFVFIKESSDFAVLYVVCLATNARLHHHV